MRSWTLSTDVAHSIISTTVRSKNPPLFSRTVTAPFQVENQEVSWKIQLENSKLKNPTKIRDIWVIMEFAEICFFNLESYHLKKHFKLISSWKIPVPTETMQSIFLLGQSFLASWIAIAVGLFAMHPPSWYFQLEFKLKHQISTWNLLEILIINERVDLFVDHQLVHSLISIPIFQVEFSS